MSHKTLNRTKRSIWLVLSLCFICIPCHAANLVIPKYAQAASLPFVIGLLALGVLLGLLAYTLFLAFSTKEHMFIYFSIIMVLLTILQTFAAYDKFIFHLTYNRVTIITHLLFITFLLFFEDFFTLREHALRLSLFNRISLYVVAGYTVLFLLVKSIFSEAATLHSVLDFIRELFVFYTNIVFLYTIIRAISWMKTEAVLILVAFIPPAILTSINAMNIFPFMHKYESVVVFLMQYNQPIGLSLQAVLFSLAMGNRYNRIKLDRQRSIDESLQLCKLDTEKTEFFMNMSHELRTPLTIILGMTRQLKQGKFGDSIKQNDRIISTIERNSLRLLKHITHMLRLEKPMRQVRIEQIPLALTLRLIIDEFQSIAMQKSITLTCSIESSVESSLLKIASDDFETMIMNLVSNAVKYTSFNGSISLEAEIRDDANLYISVIDNGPGISKTQAEHIFDRYGVGGAQSSNFQTGLGLTLTRKVIQGYGGTITVESTPGKGSTFTLLFPSHMLQHNRSDNHVQDALVLRYGDLYTQELENHESIDNQISLDGSDDRQRILIVEDDDDMRQYIASVVSEQFSVVTAESAERALQAIKQYQIDLIISDIMMPQSDGHALAESLRDLASTHPIPLIFLTARDSIEEKIESLHEGAVHYITKPFSPSVLMATVQTTLVHDRSLTKSHIETIRKSMDILIHDLSKSPARESDRRLQNSVLMIADKAGLSRREIETLQLILEGKSDKEISSSLGVSIRTVANHNQRLYHKLGVGGRYELISKFLTI